MTEEKPLPGPELYEETLQYAGQLDMRIAIAENVAENAPQSGRVLDLMCGNGGLLSLIEEGGNDTLVLTGVDIDNEFIQYARSFGTRVNYVNADVLTWEPEERYDVVMCTLGLHHLPFHRQDDLIERIVAQMLKPDGTAIVGDVYFRDFRNEQERRLAAVEKGTAYLDEAIRGGASSEVVEVYLDIMSNDILGHEFKTSVAKIVPVFEQRFGSVERHKGWQYDEGNDAGYSWFVLKNPRDLVGEE